MKYRMSFARLLLLGLGLTLAAQSITKGPYLADPKPGSIKIRWELDSERKGSVAFGENEKLKQTTMAKQIGSEAGHFLYEAKLEDLEPGAVYQYQVKVGWKKGERHHFKAPPASDAPCRFAISGDSRSRPQIFTQIIEGIAHSDPDFVISMGDLVEHGGKYEQWDKFYFGPAGKLIAERPFISTLGDHEGSGDEGVLFRYFLFPELAYDKLWYSFDYGMVHFISLDYRYADSQEMIDWFEKDVAASDARWKIVFMHRPAYNLGGHRTFWGHPQWPDLFQKHEIDIVFGGHSHIYERFKPVFTEDNKNWAITYITTGGSGAGLYESVQHPVLASAKSINHYADIQLDRDRLKLMTYKIDGTLLDSLHILKNPDGSLGENYLASASLRNELDIIALFAGPISWALDRPPLPERPAYKTFTLNSGELSKPIEFELRLSKESLENYEMEPFKGVLQPGVDKAITLKIRSKGGVKISPWGDIDPPFRIEAAYKQGSIEGMTLGQNLRMVSWGE